jgi:hypothetical protein
MDSVGPDLWTRQQMHGSGRTDSDIRRELAQDRLTAIRPGVYASSTELTNLTAAQHHMVRVRATASATDGVVSHQSAAVVHGFSMWKPDLRLVHMTVDRAKSGRTTTRRHVHAAPLGPADVVDVDGMRVTSPARTVADLARTLTFEQAVCVGDSALRTGTVTRESIADSVMSRPQRGQKRALEAVEFMDGLSETVGESRSRVMLRTFAFPAPELQIALCAPDGRFLGRCDFLNEEEGVISEFDGRVKYTKHVPPGQVAGDVAFEEKRREDELRSHGWVVVRWVWADLAAPQRLAQRIRRAFAIAATMPTPTTVRRS